MEREVQTKFEHRAKAIIGRGVAALQSGSFDQVCELETASRELCIQIDNYLTFNEKLSLAEQERNAWFYVMRSHMRKLLKIAAHQSWDRLEKISEANEINSSVSLARAVLRGNTRPLNANIAAALHYYYNGAVTVPKDELLFYHNDQQSYVETLKTLFVLGSEFCEKIRVTELDGHPAIQKGWFFFLDCFERDVAPAIDAELRTIGVGGAV